VKYIGLAILTLFIIGCSKTQKNDTKPIVDANATIEHNTTTTIPKAILSLNTNNSIQISSFDIQTNLCDDNQTIIINIFAPWAKISQNQLYTLDLLQKNYDVCVVSIAIDSNETTKQIPNINHKLIYSLQNNDFVDKITQLINIDANFKLPLNLIYKNSNFINSYQGAMPYEMLEYIIKG
jgi:hypothetical protein